VTGRPALPSGITPFFLARSDLECEHYEDEAPCDVSDLVGYMGGFLLVHRGLRRLHLLENLSDCEPDRPSRSGGELGGKAPV
jgi:hypothetical protein